MYIYKSFTINNKCTYTYLHTCVHTYISILNMWICECEDACNENALKDCNLVRNA